MKEFFDTSVLIAAFWRGHPQHEPSLKLVSAANNRKSACAAHTLAEVYATMTTLPVKDVIPPDQALLFVGEVRDRFTVITLSADEYRAVIPTLAKQFGASKVHIVAHSKGGLWSRYFLEPPGPYSTRFFELPSGNELGVLSLITLDTPHHGSILADYAAGVLDSAFVKWLLGGFPSLNDSLTPIKRQIVDLTREEVHVFNSIAPNPPTLFLDASGGVYPTVYRAVAADADIGNKTDFFGRRKLDGEDITGLSFLPSNLAGVNLGNVLYNIMGAEDNFLPLLSNNIFSLPPFTSPLPFALNDIVVTEKSAHYVSDLGTEFLPILDPLSKNHSTVGDASVAAGVLSEIRSIEAAIN